MKQNQQHISGYARYKTVLKEKISRETYQELKGYADSKGIKLENFKDYTGDIQEIIDIIDKILIVAKDFPKLIDEKTGVVLNLYFSESDDFAGTNGHIITLNGMCYNDIYELKKDYEEKEQTNHFVKGTSYKDIIYHELGHVVANIYHLNPLELLKKITNLKNKTDLMEYLIKNLSKYSIVAYEENGFINFYATEVISECFCGYYSKSENKLSTQYVTECIKLVKEGEASMRKEQKMSFSDEKTYWLNNPEWYRINHEKDCFEILDTAPAKAKISFEIWSGKRKSKAKGYFSKLI